MVADCTWSGSEKGIGEGNEPVNSSAFTDLNTLLSSLNNNAAANGYCAWIHDYTSVFGGYPIMNNACPYVFVTGISFAAKVRLASLVPFFERNPSLNTFSAKSQGISSKK